MEALPTWFVASQIYRPSSSSFTQVIVREQMLFQHFSWTCIPLSPISSPSLNHRISGKGSPLTFFYKQQGVNICLSFNPFHTYLTFQGHNTILQHFHLSRQYLHKFRNLMTLSHYNCVAHHGLSPPIAISGRDSELIFRPRF